MINQNLFEIRRYDTYILYVLAIVKDELTINFILCILLVLFFLSFYFKKFKGLRNQKDVEILTSAEQTRISKTENVPKINPGRENLDYVSRWINRKIEELDNRLSLKQLLLLKDNNRIYYGDLLNCFEWKHKRMQILIRDGFECKNCKHIDEKNHVHHTYYIQDKFPWEINNSALETLCSECHTKVHSNQTIPLMTENLTKTLTVIRRIELVCSRCGGHGYIPQYNHVLDGICFKCRGHTERNGTFQIPLGLVLENLNAYNQVSRRTAYSIYLRSLNSSMLERLIANGIIKNEVRLGADTVEEEDLPW
ncbi:hypothetical protein [Pedobacter frigiditerrae]|uniref:HNH endonuclease n=1 Tax=Pedobacter frigiditerrae TaxID=2530452 RepID=UPI00292FAB03|nr:hypothetical protein [Pedobacter frigiditerrae]